MLTVSYPIVPLPDCRCGSIRVGVCRWVEEESDGGQLRWSYGCADCDREVTGCTLEEALAKWVEDLEVLNERR